MSDSEITPGKTTIAHDVLLTIARLTTLSVSGVSHLSTIPKGVNHWFRRNYTPGIQIDIKDGVVNVDLFVVLESRQNVREISRNIQQEVARAISDMVGMEVGQISVHIEDIAYPNETTN
jgi:uncharacterized alkaline shock family protein YloU